MGYDQGDADQYELFHMADRDSGRLADISEEKGFSVTHTG